MKERKQKEKMTHSGLGGSDLGVGGLLALVRLERRGTQRIVGAAERGDAPQDGRLHHFAELVRLWASAVSSFPRRRVFPSSACGGR